MISEAQRRASCVRSSGDGALQSVGVRQGPFKLGNNTGDEASCVSSFIVPSGRCKQCLVLHEIFLFCFNTFILV